MLCFDKALRGNTTFPSCRGSFESKPSLLPNNPRLEARVCRCQRCCERNVFPAFVEARILTHCCMVVDIGGFTVSTYPHASVKPACPSGTKSREGMRDFVQAENFYAALRFDLDGSPLRCVPSRSKPFGETKKFSAGPLATPIFHWLQSRTDQRVMSKMTELEPWEWTFTEGSRLHPRGSISAATSGAGILSPSFASTSRPTSAGPANTGTAMTARGSMRRSRFGWPNGFRSLLRMEALPITLCSEMLDWRLVLKRSEDSTVLSLLTLPNVSFLQRIADLKVCSICKMSPSSFRSCVPREDFASSEDARTMAGRLIERVACSREGDNDLGCEDWCEGAKVLYLSFLLPSAIREAGTTVACCSRGEDQKVIAAPERSTGERRPYSPPPVFHAARRYSALPLDSGGRENASPRCGLTFSDCGAGMFRSRNAKMLVANRGFRFTRRMTPAVKSGSKWSASLTRPWIRPGAVSMEQLGKGAKP